MLIESDKSGEEDVEMEDESGEGEWIGLGDDGSD